MALTALGNDSGQICDPTILQYGHVQSQLKWTEEDVCIPNNNSAQFSVTDVHYDIDFSGGTKIPVRCYATVPHTQPFHTATVYSSQTYLPLYIKQPFYTMALVHCTLQNAKTSIYETVTRARARVCVFLWDLATYTTENKWHVSWTQIVPVNATETPRVVQFTSCC